MATTETKKEGSLLLSLIAGAVGFGCFLLTGAMNRHFGISLGATGEGQTLISAQAIAIDVGGLGVLALFAGHFLKKKSWIGALVTIPLLVVFAGYSITSIMGFVATERLAVEQARKEAKQQLKEDRQAKTEAARTRQETQARLAEKQLKWIQGTIRKDDLSRRERKEMLEAANKAIAIAGQGEQEPAAGGKTAPGVVMRPDAQAELLADLSGKSVAFVQLSLMVLGAILLVIMKPIFCGLAAWSWPRLVPVAVAAPAEAVTLSAETGAPSVPPPDRPAPLQLAPPTGQEGDSPVPEVSVPRAPKIAEEPAEAAAAFVSWCCDSNRAGIKYWGDEIDGVYAEYCKAQNRVPVRLNEFRRELGCFPKKVVDKDRGEHPNTKKKTTYYEIKGRPKAKQPPPPINRAGAQDVEPAANDAKSSAEKTPPPAPGGAQIFKPPFGAGAALAEAVKGPSILNRYVMPDLEAQRHESRVMKAMVRQELHRSRKQRGSRVARMARAA